MSSYFEKFKTKCRQMEGLCEIRLLEPPGSWMYDCAHSCEEKDSEYASHP
jgi:hypothetical protein